MTQDIHERQDTRTRLLRAAELLIIREGVHALTIRRVAAEAGSNSALIGYHFGGVDGLLEELARLNAEPMLEEHRERLQAALAEGPTLDGLLDAFLRPLWRGAALNPAERALVVVDEISARAEPELRRQVWGWFSDNAKAFHPAFQALLPELPEAVLRLRIRFLSAAALDLPPRGAHNALAPLEGAYEPGGEEERYRQFRAFAKGALTAPA